MGRYWQVACNWRKNINTRDGELVNLHIKITRLTRGERPALDIFVRWKSGVFISVSHFSKGDWLFRKLLIFREFSGLCESESVPIISPDHKPIRKHISNRFWWMPNVQEHLIDHFSLAARCYWGESLEVNLWSDGDGPAFKLMRNIITNTPNRPEHPRTSRSIAIIRAPLWFSWF